jgi:hypothetical protein
MPKANPLSQEQVDRLVDIVAKDIGKPKLAKADPGRETSAEQPPEGSSTAPPGSPAGAPADGPPDSPPGSPGDAGPPDGPPGDPPGDAAPGGEQPPGEGGGDDSSPEALEQAYMQMGQQDVGMLQAHYLAARAALVATMGQQGGSPGGSPDQGASPPGAAPPPPAGSPPAGSPPPDEAPGEPPVGKAEIKASPGSGGQKITKSEDPVAQALARLAKADETSQQLAVLQKTVADLTAKNSNLENLVGRVNAGFERILKRPLRKAVTNIAAVSKPGTTVEVADALRQMPRQEVVSKLLSAQRTQGGKMSKSDRDAIDAYTLGQRGVEVVAHLITA